MHKLQTVVHFGRKSNRINEQWAAAAAVATSTLTYIYISEYDNIVIVHTRDRAHNNNIIINNILFVHKSSVYYIYTYRGKRYSGHRSRAR